jgi:RNA polymerase sigma factor (sigma-70 family)
MFSQTYNKRTLLKNFEKVYKENYQVMFRIAQKMIYDKDVVSDIVQEVFIYFYEKLKQKHKIQYPKSWLYRATLNKCIDHQKSLTKFTGIDKIIDYKLDGHDLIQEETRNILKIALNNLKGEEKMLAVLYSEGFSYKEMAEVLDMNYNSIGKTLSRTLKKIEMELKKLRYEMFE